MRRPARRSPPRPARDRSRARPRRPPRVPRRPPVVRIVRFRMQSRRDAVAPTVERIIAAAAGAGLSPEQLDNLAVACAEALSNAAVHGNRLHTARLVRVLVAVRPRACAVVEVHDSGGGFDVAAVTDPTEPGRLLAPGGRGVFLMRRLVDRVEYSASGSRVRLIMERRPHRRAGDRR